MQRAEKILRAYYEAMESQPFGFAHMICALDLSLNKPKEIVIVGRREDAGTVELLNEIHGQYLPDNFLQLVAPEQPIEQISPLLQGKIQVGGKPTVYLCQNFTCSPPITTRDELRAALES